jgi:microsomal dipeptidase-like Zn-dependent dipeptidase
MTRRLAIVFFSVIVFLSLLAAGCSGLADYLDGTENGVANKPPYSVSAAAAALHPTLLVADMHSDALLSTRDLMANSDWGGLDVGRLERGSVAIQTFTQPTDGPYCPRKDGCRPFPNLIGAWSVVAGWPPGTWFDRSARALNFADRFNTLVARSAARLIAIRSADDLRGLLRRHDRGIGAVLGLEGIEALGDRSEDVAALDRAGFRLIGLVHQTDNAAGGSSQGVGKGGLTPFGRAVIREIADRRLILDLAHTSPALIKDAVESYAPRPPLLSHTGVRAVCDNARNLDDDTIRQIVRHGGLIGIGYWTDILCVDEHATAVQFADAIARSVQHVADISREVDPGGAYAHVGLGSDFDGWVDEGFDTSGLALITDALLRAHVAESDIRRVMGGNYCLFLLDNLPANAASSINDRTLCLRAHLAGSPAPPAG